MLVFDNVTKHYHYEQYPTIECFSLALTDKLNTILVDTQSGKTTLCKLVLGLEKPTSGKVTWRGNDCSTMDGKTLDATYLPAKPLLFDKKTALYNVAYPLILRGYTKQQAHQMARDALMQVGVEPDAKVKRLATDKQADVVLARLFARPSSLILIDDFLSALTQSQRQILMQFLEQSNSVVVQFTSNLDLAFGSIYLWHNGKIVTQNIKEEIDNTVWLNKL